MRIFDIQHFCLQDGPGIRTTVFMKGCPLRCRWCHNPESHISESELLFYSEKCSFCGLCAKACPENVHAISAEGHSILRDKCVLCGKCARVCPNGALKLAGDMRDADEVIKEVIRDKAFYLSSGGGVTFSGGEPLSQPEELLYVMGSLKLRGIKTAVETSCFAPKEIFLRVLNAADIMLCDIKAITPELHKDGTGVGNELILSNIRMMFEEFAGEIWIRIPVIPGFNDSEAEFLKIAEFLKGAPVKRVELMPFHDMGKSKYEALNKAYDYSDFESMPKEKLEALRGILRKTCENVV